jgi:hypothetical protein
VLPPQAIGDDKDTLAADNGSASPYRGRLYAAWTRRFSSGDWGLLVSQSGDWGQTWSAPHVLRQQGLNWGAALAVAPDGTVALAWAGSDQLWISRSLDGGAHWAPPVAFGSCLPPMDNCVFGAQIPAQSDAGARANPVLVWLPATRGQPAQLAAIYATGDGATFGGPSVAHTRIDLARFDAASARALGTPASLPIGAAGTDAFLPAASFDASDHILWVCAYVSLAYNSLAQPPTQARYTCTASRDAGTTFLPATAAASVASDEEQPGAFRNYIGRQYGDYTALIAIGGVAHAFWTDSRALASRQEEIFTCTLRLRG